MRIRILATTMAAVLITVLASAAPASAEPDTTAGAEQANVDAELAAHPGGTQIGPNQIAYPGGLIVTVTRPTATTAPQPNCPAGWFCFYESRWYGYPRGQLSSCSWQDLATWKWQDRTESVHNNLPTGSVVYLNHPAGTSSHGGDLRLFEVGTHQAIPDLGGNRNIADHVYRYC